MSENYFHLTGYSLSSVNKNSPATAACGETRSILRSQDTTHPAGASTVVPRVPANTTRLGYQALHRCTITKLMDDEKETIDCARMRSGICQVGWRIRTRWRCVYMFSSLITYSNSMILVSDQTRSSNDANA